MPLGWTDGDGGLPLSRPSDRAFRQAVANECARTKAAARQYLIDNPYTEEQLKDEQYLIDHPPPTPHELQRRAEVQAEEQRRARVGCASDSKEDDGRELLRGANLESMENWHYVDSCWDSWSEDEDPATHDIWQATSDGFINIRTGARQQDFPSRVVHGRKLIKCDGCHSHFRCPYAFQRHCGSGGFAHIGGPSLPTGPIPHAHELEDNPALCPSAILTPTTSNCITTNFTQVVHYVALRKHQSGIEFADQHSSVVFLVYPDSPWDPATQQLWTRERRNAAQREEFCGLVAARDAALAEAKTAREEATVLKGIVSRLMRARQVQTASSASAVLPAAPTAIPAALPPPNHQPALPPAVLGKRPAEPAAAPLEPLLRAQISSTLSRARARLYLKSMGASQYGEPEVLRSRLTGLFDANGIDEYRPGETQIQRTH